MKRRYVPYVFFTLLTGIYLFAAQDGATAAAEGQAAPAAIANEISLGKIIQDGGALMYVIALLSLVAIALTVFYAMTLRAKFLYPRAFILEAQDAAEVGDLEALKAVCRDSDCTAARILEASLEQCEEGRPVEYEFLRDGIEDEGGRQANLLWQRLQYLMDIAVIAPMVGLLGTIWGMMLSFQNFESSDLSAKVQQLTGGVSTAMYTTFGGLIVGILSMAAYDILRGHLSKLIGGMESACGSVLRRLSPKIRK